MPDFYKFIDLCVRQKIDDNVYKVSLKVNYELDLRIHMNQLPVIFLTTARNILIFSRKKLDIVGDITPDEILICSLKIKEKN